MLLPLSIVAQSEYYFDIILFQASLTLRSICTYVFVYVVCDPMCFNVFLEL